MTNTKLIIKRVLLVLTPLPFLIFINNEKLNWCRTLYFILPTTAVSIYITLLNFPNIVKIAHTRPVYFDDLEDVNGASEEMKHKYQKIFVIILQILLTVIMSGMFYYYYSRYHNTTLSEIEILGVFGGYISILSKIERLIGKSLLSIVNYYKKSTPSFNGRLCSIQPHQRLMSELEMIPI